MKEAAGEANMTVITIVLIAIVVGVGTILEIWNKKVWESKDEEISADEIAENMTMLGI